MNIFFSGSIRGGRDHLPESKAIVALLKKFGTVYAGSTIDDMLSKSGETDITDRSIHEREIKVLSASEVMVAEVTTPSHGVGYLIAVASQMKKPILALHHGAHATKLSAMIQGNPQVLVREYTSEEDAREILKDFFARISA